jgi:hypothetical protein
LEHIVQLLEDLQVLDQRLRPHGMQMVVLAARDLVAT